MIRSTYKLSVDKNLIIFIALIFLFAFVSPPVSVAISYIAILYGVFYDNNFAIYYFVFFCSFQNILLLVCANRFGNLSTTLFALSKEILIYGVFVINYLTNKKRKSDKEYIFFFVYMFILLFSFMISDSSVYSRMVSVRELLLPVICLLFGLTVNVERIDIKKLCRCIIYIASVIAIVGLVEIFVLGNSFWDIMPIEQYQINKGTTFKLYNGVPLNYYTWDLYSITHKVERRLVSLLVDPLMTGHFLFLAFVLAGHHLEKGKSKIIIRIILFMAMILTLCKGVFVELLIYIAFKVIRRISYNQMVGLIRYGILGILVCIIPSYSLFERILPLSSIIIHMKAFITTFSNLIIMGAGLGTAGVLTNKLTGGMAQFGGESFFAVLYYQLGILGLVVFVSMVIYIETLLFRMYKNTKNEIYFSMAAVLLGIIIEGLFSESSISIVGTGLYFILPGMFINIYRLESREKIYAQN